MDILEKILMLRESRHWSEYRLAEESGLPQSTISSWYSKKMTPTIASLEKICKAFGITMSQFFQEDSDSIVLTDDQKNMLDTWNRLTNEQKKTLLEFLSHC